MARVPLSCVTCGVSIGLGDQSAVHNCAKCAEWIAKRGVSDNFEDVAAGIATVAVAAAIGIGVMAILAALASGARR